MSEKLLEIKDLVIHYDTDGEIAHAVNGIDLEICRGEAVGLVGETGAGKTTTALSVLKLLPKYTAKIPSGSIRFDGVDIIAATDKEMRKIRGKQISMIFQDPMTSLNPVLTIGKQIAEVINFHEPELSKAEVNRRVDDVLTMVGIPPERKREYPHQFSGGMKQRVMIAIAVACEPALLIADEPTTALDVTIQAQVLNMMRRLRSRLNSAVLMITHDLGIVANFCDKVAVMYAGEIVESGTLEDIFDRTREHHPYTEGLFGSIPTLTGDEERLSPIPGLMANPTQLPSGCKFHPRCTRCTEACREGKIPVVENGTHKIKCLMIAQAEKGAEQHE